MWAQSKSRVCGMTLLELLVVIAILAMLAALLPLAIQRWMPARRLAAAARVLTIDLRQLQSQAVTSGRPLQLALESSGYSLEAVGADDGTHIPLPESIRVNLTPASILVMYPDGSSSGGEFELRSGQRVATISVSPLTGQVRVAL
jgi:general secretion pathway protein H